MARTTGGVAAVGWLAAPEWSVSTCAAGVCAAPVSAPTECGVGGRASCPAANLPGSRTREGPSVDASQRHWHQWGMVISDGFFGWRAFKNRREVGGLAGVTPTP